MDSLKTLSKLDRKRKTKAPCPVCFLHTELCICSLIPKLDLKTKVVLVIHTKELKRTTNTGRLAMHSLVNSEMRVRGLSHDALDLSDLLTNDYQTYLFYPSDDAIELNAELVSKSNKPIQLIVPDGNWRQASKVHYRHGELKNVQRVMITEKNTSTLHMRTEVKDEGMATLQAIAFALGITENQAVKDQLLNVYTAKLKRTLFGRGQLKAEDIKIPE
ncbi:MAG: DTW domain-containing protein [Bdellovibrio sp.]|nr:DTW domain-containing protein [Bdellovibrio sp.]